MITASYHCAYAWTKRLPASVQLLCHHLGGGVTQQSEIAVSYTALRQLEDRVTLFQEWSVKYRSAEQTLTER